MCESVNADCQLKVKLGWPYVYQVTAVNAQGEGEFSVAEQTTLFGCDFPSPPTDLGVVVRDPDTITIGWSWSDGLATPDEVKGCKLDKFVVRVNDGNQEEITTLHLKSVRTPR